MKKVRKEVYRPTIVTDRDAVISAIEIIKAFVEESAEPDTCRHDLEIYYDDGDRLELQEPQQIQTVQNYRSNLIKRISISSFSYKGFSVQLKLENSHYVHAGGEIEVKGSPEAVDILVGRMHEKFGLDRPISQSFASTNPWILTLLLTVAIYFLIFRNLIDHESFGVDSIVMEIFFFGSLVPLIGVLAYLIVNAIQVKFLRRFVADWGDGKSRFDRNIKITNFLVFTLPFAIGLELVIDFL